MTIVPTPICLQTSFSATLLSATLLSATLALLAGAARTQGDLLLHKFDENVASDALNMAADSTAATRFGTFVVPKIDPFTTGRHGRALRGSTSLVPGNAVDTGLRGALTGSMSFGLFVRNRAANSPSVVNGIFGRTGVSFLSGGKFGAGFHFIGVAGQPLSFLPANTALCYHTGWNHIALVIDAAKSEARWYWNGSKAQTTTIKTAMNAGASKDALLVGRDTDNAVGSLYDLDEFRLQARVASDAEVAQWAAGGRAAAVTFGTVSDQSVTMYRGANQLPFLGNNLYSVVVQGAAKAPVVLAAGLSRANTGGSSLPINIPGFLEALRIDPVYIVVDSLDPQGAATFAMPIPNLSMLSQLVVYTQAASIDSQGRGRLSNAMAHSLGN